jgi:hypothetical protein
VALAVRRPWLFTLLLDQARNHNQRLSELARAFVDGVFSNLFAPISATEHIMATRSCGASP